MNTQPEEVLEQELVDQLQKLGWDRVAVRNENDLIQNLKSQLEQHNDTIYSDKEFGNILTQISHGNIFEKAKQLRGKFQYQMDDGETGYFQLVDSIDWCKNEFQVSHQVNMEGIHKNRYDVTLLINGLPLVQIELKRRGLELKEAFNQTIRYHKHSYSAGHGLFQYIQIFVISNGVNTKYYANNSEDKLDFKQTFFWADKNNRQFSNLSDFTDVFFEPCHLSKLVTKYVVMSESDKMLMVLRQYQFHAVEAIVERVKTSNKFGYIWHTTGSGKTLTSFKTAQTLTGTSGIHKVVFVVDRKDLDYKTIEDFNSYKKDSVDGTDNTKSLIKQFNDETKLIVTTLQKLNNAIQKTGYSKVMEPLRDQRMVFIFDECHRSQFGQTHARIKKFFTNVQMIGFTGTPIFAKNAVGKKTTADLFHECLHKYVITDAINDQNVLKFSIEYLSTFKDQSTIVQDIQVEDIDKVEVLESSERMEQIVDHIISHHTYKTHSRSFNSIFCVSSINTLLRYYEIFKTKNMEGEKRLNIATIFSYHANEDDSDPSGSLDTDISDPTHMKSVNKHSRDRLQDCIEDYNKTFKTNYSTDTFYQYYQDIGKRVRRRKENKNTGQGIDILLVVNMFLTGFDSRWLNTIYVDKNLKYHGLLQAFSRTNRILGIKKSHGNVVCYRNLKSATDESVALFADKNALEHITVAPYSEYVEKFNLAISDLLRLTPSVDSVNELEREEDKYRFVEIYRNLLHLMTDLRTFSDFNPQDLSIDIQTFEDYKSKYLDLYEQVKFDRQTDKVSILDSIDFEIELIRRDEVNVSYILDLLIQMRLASAKDSEQIHKTIMSTLENEPRLRSKKELIKRFIEDHLPTIQSNDDIRTEFGNYMSEEQQKSLQRLCEEENLIRDKVDRVISNVLYTNKKPHPKSVFACLQETPKLTKRTTVRERITDRILAFVDTFFEGID
ncbi:MAG: type I restriction endonuclease subunit R [Gammaproteobacteria bacterium]|nr:type I restriction endonuclease subunit R [Gammaproteobacteria bacterium]